MRVRKSTSQQEATTNKSNYHLVWRWHFYAGLYVVPFILMLSLTGLIMLFDEEIEQIRYQSLIEVTHSEQTLAVSTQLSAVSSAYPNHNVSQFIPAKDNQTANRFSLQNSDGKQFFVTVNPYTATVLGEIDRSNSIYNLANKIHSTLLIGDWGDYLIEVSASLGILLLVTGVYLWLPSDNASRAGFLKIRTRSGKRILLRDLHANIAGSLSVVLLLFFVSGLAWTGIWGAKIVQGWNTFPTHYVWGERPESAIPDITHADLNHAAQEELPWNLELAPVPQSKPVEHDHANMDKSSLSTPISMGINTPSTIGIDHIVQLAKEVGFTQYRIFFPTSSSGVFTISANSMAGDIVNPTEDRTMHIDQYSGEVIMDVTWQDYSAIAKLMATSVSLHQGDVGSINKALNVLFCIAFIFIAALGTIMWWMRRPKNKTFLNAPHKLKGAGVWKTGLVSLCIICILFPLAGVSILVALALDKLLFGILQKSPT